MDEPLSNLDAKLRLKMRYDIKELQNSLNITNVYVTHDQEEALAVSDRIAVLNAGEIQQIGKPHEIYLSPVNRFVANFIGSTNFLDGKVGDNDRLLVAGVDLGTAKLTESYRGEVVYSVRPEQLSLATESTQTNTVNGKIVGALFLGETVEYKIRLENDQEIQVHEHAVSYQQLRSVDENVRVHLNPADAVIFNESGEEALNIYGNRYETA